MESSDAKKAGTRVFKKSSPNSKITTYLGKRDFVDHIEHIDPVDGVVLIDPEFVKDGKKVFAPWQHLNMDVKIWMFLD